MAKKIFTADRETGTKIEAFKTIKDAKKAIAVYEAEDERDGTYTPDFYDVVNEEHEGII